MAWQLRQLLPSRCPLHAERWRIEADAHDRHRPLGAGDYWRHSARQTTRCNSIRRTNKNGIVAKITNYGAIVTELHVPDRNGALADIVLGFDSLDGYAKAIRIRGDRRPRRQSHS